MRSQIAIGVGVARRRLAGRFAAPGAVVLGYHDIVDEPDGDPWSVTTGRFRAHLDVLDRLGLEVVELVTIVDRLRGGESVSGLAAITFDDALVGVYENALPVLRHMGVPATIFVVSDHLGVDPPWWPGARRTMTTDELGDAVAAGIRLGSHTRSHRSLPTLETDEVRDELVGSREALMPLTPEPVDLLAYPSGHHEGRVRQVVGESGFVAAVTFLNGRVTGGDDPLRLPRLTMGHHMRPARLAYQLRRDADSWPDHQLDSVAPGG